MRFKAHTVITAAVVGLLCGEARSASLTFLDSGSTYARAQVSAPLSGYQCDYNEVRAVGDGVPISAGVQAKCKILESVATINVGPVSPTGIAGSGSAGAEFPGTELTGDFKGGFLQADSLSFFWQLVSVDEEVQVKVHVTWDHRVSLDFGNGVD